jgi:magnesium chelatase family protein
MNPCPCGYFGDPRRNCSCAASAVGRYHQVVADPRAYPTLTLTVTCRQIDFGSIKDQTMILVGV